MFDHCTLQLSRTCQLNKLLLLPGTFKVDISNTKKLLEGERGERIREKGIIVVGESGLFTPADIAYVQEAGVKAILVGESLVKQPDPTKGISELFGKDISC